MDYLIKKIRFSIILFLWLFSIIVYATPSSNPIHSNIPSHYHDRYMVQKKCIPIKDFFYDRPFVFDPPYLVTDMFLDGEQALIMACEIKTPIDEYKYKIIIFTRKVDPNPFARYEEFDICPSEIPSKLKIGGLSITRLSGSKLHPIEFSIVPVDGIQKEIPKKIMIDHKKNLISERKSGGMVRYLCFKGFWYYHISH